MAKKGISSQQEEIIRLAGEAGAKAAIEAYENEKKKAQKVRHDRRLRNTKLLMSNYRMLRTHCENAVFEASQAISYKAVDILDEMIDCLDDEPLYVESIKRSSERTYIIISHINTMLHMYEIYCCQYGQTEDKRRYRVIYNRYISEEVKSAKDIAEYENIDPRTVYKDTDAALERLSSLIFGIDGLSISK